jgi:transcriptional regulator with XRE-family HTH domain
MSLEVLGGLCALTPAYLSMIENGKRPLERYSRIVTVAAALGVSPAELMPGMPGSQATTANTQISPARTLERQQPARVTQALDLLNSENASNVADSLAQLIDHYSHAISASPPAAVYDELREVRSFAETITAHRGREPRRGDLALATGWLSHLLAVAACDMGEHATARLWCADSERRSKDTATPELAAWALLTRAMIAYYKGQSRQSVTLAARGRAAVPIGTVAHAKLAAQEMRAAAQVGDVAHMARARTEAARAIARLPTNAKTTGVFSIALAEDPPYTATSLLLVGNYKEAIPATNRVIGTVYEPETRQRGDNPSGYARSLLILGLAQARSGCLDEAIAAGHGALTSRRPAWPTMVLAGQLDHVLATEFAGTRQAAAYHALYLEQVSRTSARTAPSPEGTP